MLARERSRGFHALTWTGIVLLACVAIHKVREEVSADDPAMQVRRRSALDARVELGRRLFFDPRVSRAGMRACADCHDPGHGFGDKERFSRDDRGPTRRHSQTIVDGAFNPSAHWDGAFRRVEELVTARVSLSQRGRLSNGHEPAVAGKGGVGPSGGESARGTPPESSGASARADGNPRGTGDTQGSGTQGSGAQGGAQGGGSGGSYRTPSSPEGPESPESPASPESPERSEQPPPPRYDGERAGPCSAGGSEREPESPESGGGSGSPEAAPAASTPSTPTTPTTPTTPSTGAAAPSTSGPSDPSSPSGPDRPSAAGAANPAGPDSPSGSPAAGTAAQPHDAPEDLALDVGALVAAQLKAEEPRAEFLHPELSIDALPMADRVLEKAGRYREAFRAAFGSDDVTIARIAEAIGAYCHSVRSGTSPYDRYVAGDENALTPVELRGLELFRGRAGCSSCHSMEGPRAAFTDYAFHVTGVSWRALGNPTATPEIERQADVDADLGAGGVSGRPRSFRAFKTPTLRDVAARAPYMHDGSLRTLEAVVEFYSSRIHDPRVDPKLGRFSSSDGTTKDLVAFLHALTSDVRPGLAPSRWSEATASTRLRFVDADGHPLPDWTVRLVPAGDLLPAAGVPAAPAPSQLRLTTDAEGRVEYAPLSWTHARIELPDGILPQGGGLVPDTCRAATIVVPVRGRARVLLTLPVKVGAPSALVFDHERAQLFPDRRVPRTMLRREALMEVGDKVLALYSAPLRTDLPSQGVLRLPVMTWGVDRLRYELSFLMPIRLDLTR